MNEFDKVYLQAVIKYKKLIAITMVIWIIITVLIIAFTVQVKQESDFTFIIEPSQIGDVSTTQIIEENLFFKNRVSDKFYFHLNSSMEQSFPEMDLEVLKRDTKITSYFRGEFKVHYSNANHEKVASFESIFVDLVNKTIRENIFIELKDKQVRVDRINNLLSRGDLIYIESDKQNLKTDVFHTQTTISYVESEMKSISSFTNVIYSSISSSSVRFIYLRNFILSFFIYFGFVGLILALRLKSPQELLRLLFR